MESFPASMIKFKEQLQKGYLQKAYSGLMHYYRALRSHFEDAYPEYSVPSNIYYGYMDMTYFSVIPESLKRRKLKIAIVFVYDTFQFEVWLSGSNRDVQAEYWTLINESGWNQYRRAPNPKTEDHVIAHLLIEDPDFSDLDRLTKRIDSGTVEFIQDVEEFFAKH